MLLSFPIGRVSGGFTNDVPDPLVAAALTFAMFRRRPNRQTRLLAMKTPKAHRPSRRLNCVSSAILIVGNYLYNLIYPISHGAQ